MDYKMRWLYLFSIFFPPNPPRQMRLLMAKAMTPRLYTAKSQGWWVGKSFCSKASWLIELRTALNIPSRCTPTQHRASESKYLLQELRLVICCAASASQIPCEFMVVALNEGTIQGSIFKNLWELLLGEVVKVTGRWYLCSVDGSQEWLTMLWLALHNKELSCRTFEYPTRHSYSWEAYL